ncbi:MAG: hypothetical protein JXA10_02300 [Anaerolineae bacterium]|nr:hypothetical protein [Anaerolineae bacterium]
MTTGHVSLSDIETLARRESAKQYHFFVGVEHLFIALTQLENGLTSAVLVHHDLSPRFVRYSIRETVGRYENRRFWPGFPETPRARQVLDMAQRYAGLQPVTEQHLLLAIMDENDSAVIRVLHEMGADPVRLRRTAANWTMPLKAQPPEVAIVGKVKLDHDEMQVLQLMFRSYGEVHVVRDLNDGNSGARVLLVRPERVEGLMDAPVVVKIDDRHAILYERRRYDLHVKGTLPAASARLLDPPVVPDDCRYGGLKYTFVGRIEDTDPISLREVARQRGIGELSRFVKGLFEALGPSWWQQPQPYRFAVWREYEHVLPPALVVEAVKEAKVGATGHELRPLGSWSRRDDIYPGEIVGLNGFVVQKFSQAKDEVQLAAGAQPEAINRASKVLVRGLGITDATFIRGEVVDRILGRVVSTRNDLLMRSLQKLEPYFDLRRGIVPSQHSFVPDLPNPIMSISNLLDRQVSGYLSTIHGDMHLGNILVGPLGDAWLIDFAWVREGHTLFDWALLELSLLIEIVAQMVPASGWEGMWDIVAMVHAINRGEDQFCQIEHIPSAAFDAVKTIRAVAEACLVGPDQWTEYFIAQALLALRMMEWQSEPVDSRRLAFLLSALATAAVQSPRDMATIADGMGGATDYDLGGITDPARMEFDVDRTDPPRENPFDSTSEIKVDMGDDLPRD